MNSMSFDGNEGTFYFQKKDRGESKQTTAIYYNSRLFTTALVEPCTQDGGRVVGRIGFASTIVTSVLASGSI